MLHISVTPDMLREQAIVYSQAREDVERAKANVMNANEQMREHWKGQAFTAYLAQFDELSQHIIKFNDLLTSINTQLNNYANTIEERDNQDRNAFGLNS